MRGFSDRILNDYELDGNPAIISMAGISSVLDDAKPDHTPH